MNRTDTAVVGVLVVLLAILAGLVGIPALQAGSATASSGTSPTPSVAIRPYREGVIGHPTSISPFTARTQADRDLVALVFSGLVRNGPDGTLVPDLAARWSVDPTGRTWTFDLEPDARWHDGEPVTADDVVFTIHTLQDPAYHGPSASSWTEVTATAVTPTRVSITLTTPLGGFLQAMTQPIAPQHLLGDVPVDQLADDPFGRQPVGSGPFALSTVDANEAVLVPAAEVTPADIGTADSTSPPPSDSLASPGASGRPSRPIPYLPGIELHFYDDAAAVAAAYRAGAIDGASGLPPEVAVDLASDAGTQLIRYPGSTLTAVLLDQRPSHPEFHDPAVRTALYEAIDRRAIVDSVWSGIAARAQGPVPPSSPWFAPSPAADPATSASAARAGLKAAGWVLKGGSWYLPKATAPLTIEVLSPDIATNETAYRVAEAVAESWRAIGIGATHVALPAAEFVTDRLSVGNFAAAVTDINIGLDPDLYPLFASSQTRTGGPNVSGIQDGRLDALLVAARAPGTDAARAAAYAALQAQFATGRYLLPIAFQDESLVARNGLSGAAPRQVADGSDRFWDVLTWRLAADR